MEYRIEHDSMGEMKVPADRLWAAQTQRSHENFKIGVDIETMPREITHAFGILKKAAAMANAELKPEKKTAEKLEIKGGVVEGNAYDAAGIMEIAKIPGREALISRLLGSMQSPITNMARVLNQIAEKGGAANCEAAPAEEAPAAE